MRLMLASVAALAAVTFAAPAFAQQEEPVTPTPVAKPKPGTAAYCNTLKTTTSKNACLKRVHAQATPKKPPTTATKGKPKKLNSPADTSAQLNTPAATPAATPAPTPPQTVTVPPLPQKTI